MKNWLTSEGYKRAKNFEKTRSSIYSMCTGASGVGMTVIDQVTHHLTIRQTSSGVCSFGKRLPQAERCKNFLGNSQALKILQAVLFLLSFD